MNDIPSQLAKTCPTAKLHISRQNSSADKTRPLFFYHVPKCGGISFANTLGMVASLYFNSIKKANPEFFIPAMGRISDSMDLKPLKSKKLPIFMLTGHLNWGAHEGFEHELIKTTLVRNPFSRIVSNYTYTCMRNQQLPSIEGFKQHYSEECEKNLMCRQLTNREGVSGKDAFEHLNNNFEVYGTTAHIDYLIEYFLSYYGFPNVLAESLNQTVSEYKIDLSSFEEQILEENAADLALFELVNNNPKLPTSAKPVSDVNSRLFSILEVEKIERSNLEIKELMKGDFERKLLEENRTFKSLEEMLTQFDVSV